MDEEKKRQEAEAAKKKEAEEAAAVEVQKKIDEAKKPLEDKLKEAETELAKLKDKDHNFNKVNKSVEEKEKEIEDLKKQVSDLASRPVTEAIENTLAIFAGKDEALKTKIKENFDRLGKDAKTATDVQKIMKEAYLLATGRAVPVDITRNSQSAGGGNNRPAPVNSGNVDPEVKNWADEFNKHLPKALQMSDDDLKNPKYVIKPGQSNN